MIVLPGASLVARGPYRWLRHPNYAVVALEIAVVPLALGLPLFALVFSAANAARGGVLRTLVLFVFGVWSYNCRAKITSPMAQVWWYEAQRDPTTRS